MYARAVEEAAARLRELRHEEWQDFGLAAVAIACALAATKILPALALPLFIGGLGIGARGIRALWRRWDLLERLGGERDAYVISEVLEHALAETTMDRRHSLAALIRCRAQQPGTRIEAHVRAARSDLEALAAELEDEALDLHPAAAVACVRLLSDVSGSPLLNRALPPKQLRSAVHQIRSGFAPRRLAA
jgi:hypothetical protein